MTISTETLRAKPKSERGRKEVRHCLLHPELVAGLNVRHNATSGATLVKKWAREKEGRREGCCGWWAIFLSLSLFLPVTQSSSPCSSGIQPGKTSAQRRSAADFIYCSIFSHSRAQLFLTNMSSWPGISSNRIKDGRRSWPIGGTRRNEGAGYIRAY